VSTLASPDRKIAGAATPKQLLEGSEAIVEAAITAGCRFFAGYPMTPFTELLEHFARRLPEVDGTCINAESELEAVGMAWGALAAGARAATGSTGQGLSLMQESFSEITLAELPLVIFNMARGQQDYFQSTRGGGHGDYRHIVLAPVDIGEAVELTQLAFDLADRWRNPVLVYGDYLLAHVTESVAIEPIDFDALPLKDWAVDGSRGGTGRSRSISPLGLGKHGNEGPGIERHLRQIVAKLGEIEQTEARVETAHVDDADTVVVAFGTPARFVRYAVEALRADGERIGYVRPITLWPYPSEAVRDAAAGARVVGVFELCAGQMIDDVRLGVLGAVPVVGIGGISTDGSGFGVGPLLDAEIIRDRILALHRGGPDAVLPPLPVNDRG
jgi:2-oxoglutarate/2-oxoacid ferredoxin oxidoreductase subunit alpha